jgi:hypothetical protein
MALTLREKRVAFTECVAKLIIFAFTEGYEPALDQVKRTAAEASANAAKGTGIRNSLHLDGLAVDLLLYRDGRYLTESADYRTLGAYWKSLHPLSRWGGDFSKPDGNHFSLEHDGRR